jgi:hypothetical protein
VQLDSSDIRKYRVARGTVAPPRKSRAVDAVAESEGAVDADDGGEPSSDRAAARRSREILFAACTSEELAWETNGQGDFTRFTAPLLRENIGRVSNREFFDLIKGGFDAFRQNPDFTAPPKSGDAPLLAVALAPGGGKPDPQAPADGAPVAKGAKDRDAALAMILHGLADLLQT